MQDKPDPWAAAAVCRPAPSPGEGRLSLVPWRSDVLGELPGEPQRPCPMASWRRCPVWRVGMGSPRVCTRPAVHVLLKCKERSCYIETECGQRWPLTGGGPRLLPGAQRWASRPWRTAGPPGAGHAPRARAPDASEYVVLGGPEGSASAGPVSHLCRARGCLVTGPCDQLCLRGGALRGCDSRHCAASV